MAGFLGELELPGCAEPIFTLRFRYTHLNTRARRAYGCEQRAKKPRRSQRLRKRQYSVAFSRGETFSFRFSVFMSSFPAPKFMLSRTAVRAKGLALSFLRWLHRRGRVTRLVWATHGKAHAATDPKTSHRTAGLGERKFKRLLTVPCPPMKGRIALIEYGRLFVWTNWHDGA